MKAVVAAFNQEKALVGAFSVITNLRMELFRALPTTAHLDRAEDGGGRGGGGGGHGQEGGGAHAVAHVAHLANQRRGLRSRDCSPPITAHLAARDARALPQSRGQVQRGVLVHTEPGQLWLQ